MKLKNILFVCSLVVVSTTKGADASASRGANVNLNEPTVSPQEIKSLVDAELRKRANAVRRFGAGEDGLLWRTVHKVRSGASLVGHVAKYPAVVYCAVTGPLYWYVRDEFLHPVGSFIRENFTLVTGVLVAGGLGAGLYYGPKDHAVTEGYKKLTDDVADHKAVAQNLAEQAILERKRGEQLQNLHGVLGQVNDKIAGLNVTCAAAEVQLNGLRSEAERTTRAVVDAKREFADVKDQTAKVVREQQETKVIKFIEYVQGAIAAENDHFRNLKAIEANPATATDGSLLQVELTRVQSARLCQEALVQMHRNTMDQGLPEDLQRLLEEFMTRIQPRLNDLHGIRVRVDELSGALRTTHQLALETDARKMAALVAAAERRALLPAPAAPNDATIVEAGDAGPAAVLMATPTLLAQLRRPGGMVLQNAFGGFQVARPLPFAPSNGSQSVDVVPQDDSSSSVSTTPTVEEVD